MSDEEGRYWPSDRILRAVTRWSLRLFVLISTLLALALVIGAATMSR